MTGDEGRGREAPRQPLGDAGRRYGGPSRRDSCGRVVSKCGYAGDI